MIPILDNVYFGNTIFDYLIFFAIIVGSLIVGRAVFYISKRVLRKKAEISKTKIDDILVEAMEKPLVFLIFIIGFIIALKTLNLSPSISKIFSNIVQIILTINIFWFVIYFVDALLIHYITPLASKTKSELDDALLPVVRRLVKVTLIVIAVIIIIDNFGYDVTSLIAGLGIGGLAFALAAKDMLANLFGGMSILTDKPFKLGDRIKIEDYDGWVREIGLRTTKMETLDGFQLIVPNAKIADTILQNVSREKSRKVKATIGVEYDTPMRKMEEAKKILEDVVLKNKDTENRSIVSFKEFGDSSLNFLVIYWIKNLDNILNAKHNINMEIKKRFEKAKIEMAFPTRTVYLKK
ncbi:MAG: mechanosensitive ion channel family protein [Nanoarchaeota archaeon]|nr:mechanosensitive ion channel family protein [DPANN group archaeon]MBL7116360.1 mechanosensitive ion channel family protein [Nanoarchaeota archaeon]